MCKHCVLSADKPNDSFIIIEIRNSFAGLIVVSYLFDNKMYTVWLYYNSEHISLFRYSILCLNIVRNLHKHWKYTKWPVFSCEKYINLLNWRFSCHILFFIFVSNCVTLHIWVTYSASNHFGFLGNSDV